MQVALYGSRKYPCPPQGRFTEIPRGRGVLKAQFSEQKYDTKMEFPEGWGGGFNLKNLPWEGYGYFLEHHNLKNCIKIWIVEKFLKKVSTQK